MHFSGGGGGGGHGGGGGGMGHSSGGHSSASGGHHGGEGGGLSIGQILGLNHGHAGGGGLFGHLTHNQHGAQHHHHHAGGEPDQSPSWNMAMQAEKVGLGGFLRKMNLRFTPAVGFFFLFVGLTFWLGVIYQLRHHEPTENFSAISKQLYGQQLPTTRVGGQTLPTVGVSDPANGGSNSSGQSGSAPASQGFTGSAQAAAPQTYAAAPAMQPQFQASYPQVAYSRFGTPAGYSPATTGNAPAYAVYGGQRTNFYGSPSAYGSYPGRSNGSQRWRLFVSH